MEPIFMRKRMAQIRKHLGPVMEKMGLEAGCEDQGWRYLVYFQTERSFSPIFLVFTHKRHTEERRPSWSEARILHEDWRKKKLGDTGWVHQRKWRESLLRIEGEGEGMFPAIARKLQANKLVTFEREPMKMACANLADIFWSIDGRIPDLAVTRVPDELLPGDKEAEFDALTFIDHDGRRIHLCLRQGDGRGPIYADGEEIARIHTDELRKVAEFAVALSSGRDVAEFTLRR